VHSLERILNKQTNKKERKEKKMQHSPSPIIVFQITGKHAITKQQVVCGLLPW